MTNMKRVEGSTPWDSKSFFLFLFVFFRLFFFRLLLLCQTLRRSACLTLHRADSAAVQLHDRSGPSQRLCQRSATLLPPCRCHRPARWAELGWHCSLARLAHRRAQTSAATATRQTAQPSFSLTRSRRTDGHTIATARRRSPPVRRLRVCSCPALAAARSSPPLQSHCSTPAGPSEPQRPTAFRLRFDSVALCDASLTIRQSDCCDCCLRSVRLRAAATHRHAAAAARSRQQAITRTGGGRGAQR